MDGTWLSAATEIIHSIIHLDNHSSIQSFIQQYLWGTFYVEQLGKEEKFPWRSAFPCPFFIYGFKCLVLNVYFSSTELLSSVIHLHAHTGTDIHPYLHWFLFTYISGEERWWRKWRTEDNSKVVYACKAYIFGYSISLPTYVNVKMNLHSLRVYQLYTGIGAAGWERQTRKKWPPVTRETDRRQSSIYKCALNYPWNK